MNVLIIDDDIDIINSLVGHLEYLGHSVTSCLNIMSAHHEIFNNAFKDKYNLAIIDLILASGHEGMDILQKIRKKSPKTEVIMISVKNEKMTSVVSRAFSIGIHTFLDKKEDDFMIQLDGAVREVENKMSDRIFISHGHNEVLKLKLKDFIRDRLKRDTLILSEFPSRGLTIVETLEKTSKLCNQAVVLLTKDDETSDGSMRARQNVIHEIGFFQGKYGRENVILLCEKGVDLFSNISV